MVPTKTVVVLTPYRLCDAMVKGGAQRVAVGVCEGLVALGHECIVLQNSRWEASLLGTASPFGSGENRMTRWSDQPRVERTVPDETARRAVRGADVTVVLDRAVGRLPTNGASVLLLSNLAYENERRAAAADWNGVWVPSPFLAAELGPHLGPSLPQVHVVPPMLAEPKCRPDPHRPVTRLRARLADLGVPPARRLLFPHRADPGKGLLRTLDLLRTLVSDDPSWTMIATAATPQEGSAGHRVEAEARRVAHALGLERHLLWVPWLSTSEMPCLYRSAGCTLMASSMPEGFALVPVESVAAGVPVVTTAAGNVRQLADQFQSITTVDRPSGPHAVAAVRAAVSRAMSGWESAAIRARFSRDAQLAALASGLTSLPDNP